ncbi:hypothetical protein [Nocardia cyriacigeorgica]|jgi:hypothetical protein|uniref:hypothetical protein n=1 Tax=Nocardia cyriacigeorgica TaxID=135487 RepID=UPI0024586257|nr:hypothetical protein [Nocardia cyriacigeorgica]
MTPEEIRAEAIETILRKTSRGLMPEFVIRPWAEEAIDALAEAGLLPTGARYGVGSGFTLGEFETGCQIAPCCIHPTLDAARLDQAAHEGPIRRQWMHDWQEVTE